MDQTGQQVPLLAHRPAGGAFLMRCGLLYRHGQGIRIACASQAGAISSNALPDIFLTLLSAGISGATKLPPCVAAGILAEEDSKCRYVSSVL